MRRNGYAFEKTNGLAVDHVKPCCGFVRVLCDGGTKNDESGYPARKRKGICGNEGKGFRFAKIKLTTKSASDEVFETLRLERQDEMSKKQEELTNKLASTDLTPDEKARQWMK